tara:strand:- start:1195 stop:1605 length:411 start_codon:yes stop_codon:yes gene_type:complete
MQHFTGTGFTNKRSIVRKVDELKNWNVNVPYVLYKTFGPIEAYDEDEAIEVWNKNRRKYRSLGDGDLGSPIYDYRNNIWEAEATETNKIVKKSISSNIREIILDIESLIATDADNNSGKVPYLQSAVDALNDAINA